jgi:hypothetical protein
VLVESNAWPSLGQDYSKRGLATLQRIRSEIVTVQFDQVEGVQENAFVMVPVANALNNATPLSSQATASPSMMQERERSRASASTISGRSNLPAGNSACSRVTV